MKKSKRLIRPNDPLSLGTVFLQVNRFDKKKYTIWKIAKIFNENEIALECLKSSYYRVGYTCLGMKSALAIHKYYTELHYLIPGGNLLYGPK